MTGWTRRARWCPGVRRRPVWPKSCRRRCRTCTPSYQQEQRVRAYRAHSANELEMARLLIPSWNIPGRDIRAMTFVINAYLRRRHYHSWFGFSAGDEAADSVVRHTVANPSDISFVATKHGEMSASQWREHILETPSPLHWDCFRFGVIQRADHFTFYACIDHVHADAMFVVPLVHPSCTRTAPRLGRGRRSIKLPEAWPVCRLLRPSAACCRGSDARLAGCRGVDRLPPAERWDAAEIPTAAG